MKRNLNLIATAASLILLGWSGESHALQIHQDSLVGSGILSSDESGMAITAPPLINRSAERLISDLKPLTMPKLKRFATSGRPASSATGETAETSSVNRHSGRLPDAGVPAGYGVPPIVKASSRKLRQKADVARDLTQPPIIKSASRHLVQGGVTGIPPVVKSDSGVPTSQTVGYFPQGSSSRGTQGSATRTPLPPIVPGGTPLPLPLESGNLIDSKSSQQSVVVQSPGDTRSPGYFSQGPGIVEQPVFDDGGCSTCAPVVDNEGACASCGTGMSDGVCPTCGPGAGYSDGPVIEDFGTFGLVSAARCYLHAEALLFTRGDGDIVGQSIASLNEFDSGAGLRLTFGRKSDSINGREIGLFLLSGVEQDSRIEDSPFLVEDFQEQSKASKLYSVEYNRVNFGWDVVKTFAGLKFIRFDDSYRFQSIDADPTNNRFSSLDSVNNLFGAHLGGELFYDIGYRWSGSVKGSWGLYANFSDFDSTSGGASGALFSRESNQGTISTSAELNFLAHYQIQTDVRFQVGYNLIFIGNVASVSDNLNQQVPTLNGIDVSDSDDVLFHGISFGLEFYR